MNMTAEEKADRQSRGRMNIFQGTYRPPRARIKRKKREPIDSAARATLSRRLKREKEVRRLFKRRIEELVQQGADIPNALFKF